MDDPRSVIQRSLAHAGSESFTLESFYRRRDRKRVRTRFTAGVVGLAIAIAVAVVGSAILRSAPDDKDVGRDGRILREGEVLQVEDQFGPMATLVAENPATGHQRFLHECSGRCGWIQEFNPSPGRGWIAWEESCGSAGCVTTERGLWVAGADGSTIPVTSSAHPPDPGGGWIWAWSPAADQLVFATGRPGLEELVLFDPDSGQRTSLANVEGISALSWSPDGTAIAIASSSGVSIIDLATGHPTSIGRIGAIEDHDLSWSPDATRLALASRGSIIVLSADGSDRRVLVDHGGHGEPAWSPDGARIAYLRTPGSAGDISLEAWVIKADGSDATRLFHGECCIADWWGPFWSLDGKRIAFFDNVDAPLGSFLAVNADGTGSAEQVDGVVVSGWIQG